MLRAPRNITVALACLLALALALPTSAAAAPAGEEYILKVPDPGADGTADKDAGSGSQHDEEDRAGGVAGVATQSADEGGLPILLVILAGTALAGASIAMARRRRE